MRYRRIRSLFLSLAAIGGAGLSLTAAWGGDTPPSPFQPYPPVERAAPRPSVEAPLPIAAPVAESSDVVPAVSLERPIALGEKRDIVDGQVQPTLFDGLRDRLANSSSGTFTSRQQMPVGPIVDPSPLPAPTPLLNGAPTQDVPYSWKQTPTTMVPGASSIVPVPSGSVVSGPVAAPGVAVGPTGAPLCDSCTGDGACCDGACCDGCGWGNCGCCGNGCCFGNRWYASAEYLLWFIRGQPLPPLLTTGPLTDNPPGALGQPGTMVLFGNNSLNTNPYSGVRLRVGRWFNDNHGLGLDVGGFILGGNANRFNASSMGTPFLARPFFNTQTGLQDIEAVATPNGLTGNFSAVNTFFLYGAEANLRRNLWCGCNWFIDGFVGWRLLGLNEALTIRENLAVASSVNPNLPAGSTFIVTDRFATTNLYNGGQIGGIGEYRIGRWSADVRGSLGVGGVTQYVNISGSTITQVPGAAATSSQGGLLAQSSNIGQYTRSHVAFVDEIGFNVGYQFTNHIRGFIGYNFLYISSVVRPGNQIDQAVNPNLIPPSVPGGVSRPTFVFNPSDFWVQGVTLGLDFRW